MAGRTTLLDQPARGRFDKCNEFRNIGRAIECRPHFHHSLRGIELRSQQQAECALDRANPFTVKATPLETDRINSVATGVALGHDTGKGRHILRYHSVAADIGMTTDSAELMDGGK